MKMLRINFFEKHLMNVYLQAGLQTLELRECPSTTSRSPVLYRTSLKYWRR